MMTWLLNFLELRKSSMTNDPIVLPPRCKELKGSQLLAEWVATLCPTNRNLVLNRIQAFLEGDLSGVFILRNGIVEIRIHDPVSIYVYFYFDVVLGSFDFMRGLNLSH
jgi:putative component of toxin-antitoxin plasmid stabilization module